MRNLKFEILIGCAILLFTFLYSSHLDIVEHLIEWSRKYEKYELDELLAVSVVLVFMLLAFSLRRIIELSLKNKELQIALNEIDTLKGIIPICSYCKEIRNTKGIWSKLEAYIHEHSKAKLSPRICPKCISEKFSVHSSRGHKIDKTSKAESLKL